MRGQDATVVQGGEKVGVLRQDGQGIRVEDKSGRPVSLQSDCLSEGMRQMGQGRRDVGLMPRGQGARQESPFP